jgi:hypothetical protein
VLIVTTLNKEFLQTLRDNEELDEDVLKTIRRVLKDNSLVLVYENDLDGYAEMKQRYARVQRDVDFDPWGLFY